MKELYSTSFNTRIIKKLQVEADAFIEFLQRYVNVRTGALNKPDKIMFLDPDIKNNELDNELDNDVNNELDNDVNNESMVNPLDNIESTLAELNSTANKAFDEADTAGNNIVELIVNKPKGNDIIPSAGPVKPENHLQSILDEVNNVAGKYPINDSIASLPQYVIECLSIARKVITINNNMVSEGDDHDIFKEQNKVFEELLASTTALLLKLVDKSFATINKSAGTIQKEWNKSATRINKKYLAETYTAAKFLLDMFEQSQEIYFNLANKLGQLKGKEFSKKKWPHTDTIKKITETLNAQVQTLMNPNIRRAAKQPIETKEKSNGIIGQVKDIEDIVNKQNAYLAASRQIDSEILIQTDNVYTVAKQFFIFQFRKQYDYTLKFIKWYDEHPDKNTDEFREKYERVREENVNAIGKQIEEIKKLLEDFQNTLEASYDRQKEKLRENQKEDEKGFDEHQKKDMEDRYMKTKKKIQAKFLKIKSLYDSTYDMLDIIIDNHFIYTYVFKVVNFAFLLGSVYLGEKLFTEMYMRKVYANNQDPPNLIAFYGIILGFLVAFNIIMLIILLLIIKILNSSTFVINGDLLLMYIKDFGIFIAIATAIFSLIGYMMQIKKYFRYKTEGLRAIRAYKESIILLSTILIAVPYFAIF